jgi:hypothetical protein
VAGGGAHLLADAAVPVLIRLTQPALGLCVTVCDVREQRR